MLIVKNVLIKSRIIVLNASETSIFMKTNATNYVLLIDLQNSLLTNANYAIIIAKNVFNYQLNVLNVSQTPS